MITIRKADSRGKSQLGWLDSRHSFSFADYYDPSQMGFGKLRVINDDRVAPGQGFGTHGHRDMEILSYVLDGSLEHKDSIGTGSVIRPGDVQRMTAGTGVRHSEFNPSPTEPVHFLQIWIEPSHAGLPPSYEQRTFSDEERSGKLRLIASEDGVDGSLTIHQDVQVYAGVFRDGESARVPLGVDRRGWLQVARGRITFAGKELGEGDGAAVSSETELELRSTSASEVLWFDLA